MQFRRGFCRVDRQIGSVSSANGTVAMVVDSMSEFGWLEGILRKKPSTILTREFCTAIFWSLILWVCVEIKLNMKGFGFMAKTSPLTYFLLVCFLLCSRFDFMSSFFCKHNPPAIFMGTREIQLSKD